MSCVLATVGRGTMKDGGAFLCVEVFFYVLSFFFVERVSCVLTTVGRGAMKDGSVFLI